MFWTLIALLIVGAIAGAVARLLIPGRQPMGIAKTILLGIVGSFVGGLLGDLLFTGRIDGFEPAGLIGSIIGAVIVLFVYTRVRDRRSVGGGRTRG